MFEDQYRKHYQNTLPSQELNDETLALMQEAQDHRATEPERSPRWRPAVIIPLTATLAATITLVVLMGIWLRDNDTPYSDDIGTLDTIINNSEEEFNVLPETDDSLSQEEEQQEEEPAPEQSDDTETKNTATPEPETEQPEENKSDSGTEKPKEEAKPEETVPEDTKEPGNKEEEEPAVDSVDPRDPDIINDETTATYTTIRAFLNALANKETPGYGEKYYNAKELIIVPAKLPNRARFRHFHLYTDTGKYAYSYIFTKDNTDYFIDIEVDAYPPLTLRDLYLQKQEVKTEEIRTGKKGNQLFFLFGKKDYITVTLTQYQSNTALTEEQVAELLKGFKLERCSLTNVIIDMTY